MAAGDSGVRPILNKQQCIMCRYCYSDIYGDYKCLFLFEMMMFHKIIPSVNCPMTKDV